MIIILLPLLVTAFTSEPPTTINGQVMGPAEEFATAGPARVCLKDTVISPRDGETVYLEYLGIHDARLRLVLADGSHVMLTQGDAFQDQRNPGQEPAIQRLSHRYYLIGDDEFRRYQMVAVEGASREGQHVLFLSGPKLSGNQSDEQVFDRLSFPAVEEQRCDREFGYGWDGIFWTNPTLTGSE